MRHLAIAVAVILASFLALSAVGVQATDEQEKTEEKKKDEPKTQPESKMAYVLLDTSKGDIIIELNGEKAPITVANFLRYTDNEAYNGTIFHRVIANFMIQGGGFDKEMNKRPQNATIKNEWKNGLKNARGTISMARLGGQPDSGSNQFFINVKDNPSLDRAQADGAAYAVFGKVHAGMKVVDAIKDVPTGTKGRYRDVPTEPVMINTARRISKEEADAAKARTR